MYRTPSRRAEQVSQALLGEAVRVLEARGGWRRIQTEEPYEGWAPATTLVLVSALPAGPLLEVEPLWANLRELPDSRCAARLTAFAGTRLPLVREVGEKWVGLGLPGGGTGWTERIRVRPWSGEATEPPAAAAVLATAERFLGVPYLWGGRTPLGLDCSGFVQLTWRLQGYRLPRDAHQQAECGAPVDPEAIGPADLLFFGPEEGGRQRITHVGISLNGEEMIHAAGSRQVRHDAFRTGHYGERFLFARRVVG